MLDDEIALLTNRQAQPFSVIKGLVTEFNFINVGTIKAIHNENYIDVQTYYKNGDKSDNVLTDVRLLQLGTTKCKVFIQPTIGDNVLLLTPKDFVSELTYNEKPKNMATSFMPYGNINACAILIRDESDDNVKTTVTINENGDITVDTKGEAFVDAKNIHLNGDEKNSNESHLVRYEELEKGLDDLWSAIKTHTHPVSTTGSATSQTGTASASADLQHETLDIKDSKIDTVLTEKASS